MSDRWESLLSRPPIRPDWSQLQETLAGQRVLVTGSGGSVGQTLVAALAEANVASLTLVETHEPSLFHQRQVLTQTHREIPCRCVLADVRDQRKMATVFADARPDLVFHLAAYKQVPLAEENVDQVIAVNVFAALDLAKLAVETGVACFLYPSTDKAVRPPSIYGATKRLVELGLRAIATADPRVYSDRGAGHANSHTALRSVRLVNVVGSQGSVVDVFRRQIAAGRPLTLTDPAHTRYWVTVDEATYLLTQVACASDLGGGPFFLDAGPAIPMGEFIRQAIALLAPEAEPPIQIVGSRPGERQHEELVYPFETPRSTSYPGILEAVDRRDRAAGRAAAAALWDRIERLRHACEQSDVAEVRRALFAVVEEEAMWSHP